MSARTTYPDDPSAADSLDGAQRQLALLCVREPAGGLVELRFRRPGGPMRQRFYSTARLRQAAQTALWLGRRHDVYVGCAPRRRRAGGRSAIERSWTLWVDCDTDEAAEALSGFAPAPTLVVRSGSGENRHAYWVLDRPLATADVERLNLRIARALGGDDHAYDAARVLRIPGTHNHKHDPPAPVTIDSATGELHDPDVVAGELPDPDYLPRRLRDNDNRSRRPGPDPLLDVAPPVYVEALTGLRPGRDGKIACPFHADDSPSLHVYRDAAAGWYCYGCHQGGSIYDLAAQLWDRELRGREFLLLRRDLEDLLDGEGVLERRERPEILDVADTRSGDEQP
ncbi:MAG: hypothetical protein H0T19_00100 [Thermoleophilaceae bacterium]|nr:hypothetical protein [Thermoleophilaceae bacterium]